MLGIGMYLLYGILGWRSANNFHKDDLKSHCGFDRSALVGMAVMTVLLPLPGYVAKLAQSAQIERMKKVSAS